MTIGAFLGPYRNLTTLTSAVLALHPKVQVMNHGFERMAASGALEAFVNPSDESVGRFRSVAANLSEDGKRGHFGGSILHSHAFDHPAMQEAYQSLHRDKRLKDRFDTLIWKESWALTNWLLRQSVDPSDIVSRTSHIRFISPIRNPLDHARSLLAYYPQGVSHDSPYHPGFDETTLENVLTFILDCHFKFLEWWRRRPDRFIYFHEREIGADTLFRLACLLDLEPLASWLEAALPVFKSKTHYEHSTAEKSAFFNVLHGRFRESPWFIAIMTEAAGNRP